MLGEDRLTADTWELMGSERFELLRRLGSGGFGAVYEVFDHERSARVALKVLQRLEPEDLYRFKQEFRALTGITHPNLVRLYELFVDDDRCFFTMELVEGTSALAFVSRGRADAGAPTLGLGEDEPADPAVAASIGAVDEARLRAVLVQLVEGLAALHQAGKMHRDVKPSNVLVTGDGRVVVVDFGLAVRLSASGELSRSNLVGTPAYLAPEIIRGLPATAESDWYAVGVLLYEALTRQAPFTGPLQVILGAKISLDVAAPSTLAPGVPADLDQLCVDLLARDPDARPTAAQILERLGSAHASTAERRAAPFIGRASERAALADLFQFVRRGEGAAVALVGGVSGIGKSALLSKACLDIRQTAPGSVLLTGRCWEQESVPYKAVDGLIDALSRYLKALPPRLASEIVPREVRALAGLFPVLEQVQAIADSPMPPLPAFDVIARRRAGFRALRELFTKLGRHRPLVLVIDDLQWGDRDSGALLLDLMRPPSPPLLLVVAYRSDEAETSACLAATLPALRALGGEGVRVASIEVEALGEAEARALASTLLPEGAGGELAQAVAREAGRRPFFIHELAKAWPAAAVITETQVSLDALVRVRADALPEPARRLLQVVCVAGRPIDRAVAARAARLGDDEPASYGTLRDARLLRVRDTVERHEIEPYHDRIREAVAAGIPAEQRAATYLALAHALSSSDDADPETRATYFLLGGSPDRAVDLARQAAEAASGLLAFDRAARLHRFALDTCAPDDARAQPLREALAEALVTAGRGAEAAEAYAIAARTAAPDRAFDLRRRATEQLLFAGRADEGSAALRGCLAEIGFTVPDAAWRRALGALWGIVSLVLRGFRFRSRPEEAIEPRALLRVDTLTVGARAFTITDTVLAIYLCTHALRAALAAGEPRRTLETLALFSAYTMVIGGSTSRLGRRLHRTIEQLAQQIGDTRARGTLDLLAANEAMQSGNPRAAREPVRAAAAVVPALRLGASWEANLLHELTCFQLHWSGAWKELALALATMLDEARSHGNQHLERSLSNWFGHVPALLADDPERAERVQREARSGWWPPQFGALDHFSLLSRVEILLYADHGGGPAAHRYVEAEWQNLIRAQLHRLAEFAKHQLDVRGRAALAFAASSAATPDERRAALAIVERSARRLARLANPLAKAFGAIFEAGLAAARGEADAAARYERAEAAFTAIGCAHYAAAARWRRGAILGGVEGRALVAEASAIFAAEGAQNPARLAATLAPGPALG